MHADTIIEARWILPILPRGIVFEDYAVVLNKGRITALLPIEDARRTWTTDKRFELPSSLVMPGLVNLHSHAAMNLIRGLGADLPLKEWLTTKIWPAEARLLSADFVEDGSWLAGLEMAASGITTTSDMYFFPDSAARGLRRAGLRCAISGFAIGFPSAWAQHDAEYLEKAESLLSAYKHDPFVRVTVAPHAPYSVSDAVLLKCAELSEQYLAPIHIHLHETAAEISDSVRDFGIRPLERLRHLGLVNDRLIAVHAVHLNEHDIEALSSAGASVCHCPCSNLKLASGFAPIAKLLSSGINLGIGTDGAASNDKLDLLEETRLAAMLAKAVSGDTTAAPVHDMLWSATMGGAKALHWDTEIGSIECGKAADLISIDLSGVECLPVRDPAAQLLYASGRESITHTWVAGELLPRPTFRKALTTEAQSIAAKWQNML